MGRYTGISWTDHTMNPWWGCTKVSPGCDNCYAEGFDRRMFPVQIGTIAKPEFDAMHWGKGAPRREFGDKHWNEPLKWNRDALKNFGRPARVFCASMADIMDDEAPAGARERLWKLIDSTPNLIWQLLTKRPHRYLRYLPKEFKHANVMLGTTAENQEHFDVRFPLTMQASIEIGTPCWISYEPALGPLSIRQSPRTGFFYNVPPDWVICGGESGPDGKRRPFEAQWGRDLLEECNQLGVAFFMKQMSARTAEEGKRLIEPDLMVQEFPAWPGVRAVPVAAGDVETQPASPAEKTSC